MTASIQSDTGPRSPSWKASLLAVLALWIVVEAALILGLSPILKGDLADSDAYLQLVKVSRLVETADWYDNVLPRSNWPHGEIAAWTRSLDIVLLAGAQLFRPFMNFHSALFWFGVVLSPLCALGSAFAVGWMAKPLLGTQERFGAMLLLLFQPGLLSYTYARGANHHGILFLSFIFACGFALRALKRPENRQTAIWGGVMTGVGLWISVEFLLPLVVTLIAFGLLWLLEGDRWVRVNRGFVAGFFLALAVLLPIERSPFRDLFADEYDRLSIVHLTLALFLLGFWALVPLTTKLSRPTVGARGLAGVVGTGFAAIAMYAVYPKFFGGPLVDTDSALIPFLVTNNADWQPTAPTSLAGLGRFLVYLGPPVLCLLWALRQLWTRRRDETAPCWMFLTLMLLLYVAMTMRSVRFAAYAEITCLIPLLDLVEYVYGRLNGRQSWRAVLTRTAAVTAIIIGLPVAGVFALAAAFPKERPVSGDSCRLAEIVPVLNDPAGLGARQQLIVAEIHSGSEILYRTPHAVLATPMFRNPGILDAYHILAAADDTAAKAIVDARQVDLILLCPQPTERHVFSSDRNQDTLYNRLIGGRLPTWIQPVALSGEAAKHFRLFAVRHQGS